MNKVKFISDTLVQEGL